MNNMEKELDWLWSNTENLKLDNERLAMSSTRKELLLRHKVSLTSETPNSQNLHRFNEILSSDISTCKSKIPEILSGEQEFFELLVLSIKTNLIMAKQDFENKCPFEMYK